MNFKKTIFLATLAFVIILQSCSEYKKTDSGLQYKIVKDSAGPNAQRGGGVFAELYYKNEKDSFRSFRGPVGIKIDTVNKGGFDEIYSLLSEGDSAVFLIRNDTLYKNVFEAELPKELKPEGTTIFHTKVVKVLSVDTVRYLENKNKEAQIAMENQRRMQEQLDTLAILEYCKINKLTAKRTPKGMYIAIKKPADGFKMQFGDTASVFYTGKLLNGTKFDSNVGKQPFNVPVGGRQVIEGWDEGLMQLRKGEKAIFLIPSRLGYGERGAGPSIPPNSVLIFDIEVLK